MASVVINGDTSGSVSLTVPTAAGSNTATLPAATGTVMVSGNMPAFSYYAGSATSLSGGGFTKVLFDTKEFDTNNNFASSKFTPTVAGYYQINGGVSVGTNAQVVCSIYKNGSEYKRGSNISTNTQGTVVGSVVYFNGSTDYVEIYCFSSVTQNTQTNAYWGCYFNGSMVRSA